MQFVVVGRDGTDPGALDRRLAVREAHLHLGDQLRDSGNMLFGVAILNEQGQMAGSVLVVDFPTRDDVDRYLAIEPYAVHDVWRSIDVEECRVGPSFQHLRPVTQ